MGSSQILLENYISIFKKLVSRRKHEVLIISWLNGCSDVGFQKTSDQHQQNDIASQIITACGNLTLDFKQLGLWASPPFLQVSKWNTKLALIWKRTFEPLGKQSSSSSPSPGKTLLTTTVVKFLDTSVCDALTPASVHSLWSSPKFLNLFYLRILIRLLFSWSVVHLFLPHFFLPLNFLLTCLDYRHSVNSQLLWQWMLWLTLLVKGVNDCLLDNCQISSLPHDCEA